MSPIFWHVGHATLPPPAPKCRHRKVRASNVKGTEESKTTCVVRQIYRQVYSFYQDVQRVDCAVLTLLSGQEFSTPPYTGMYSVRVHSLSRLFMTACSRWNAFPNTVYFTWDGFLGNEFDKKLESFAPCYSQSLLLAGLTENHTLYSGFITPYKKSLFMNIILKNRKTRGENQTKTRVWGESSSCPETSTKTAVQEYHLMQ